MTIIGGSAGYTQFDLYNEALSQIGAQRILSIADGSTNATLCEGFYPMLRDSLLRAYHWNFALTWIQLEPDVTAPIAQFAYAYTLPDDCLRVVGYGGNLPASVGVVVSYDYSAYIRPVVQYKIEGRQLLSNDAVAYVHYLRRVDDVAEWDALFYQFVATYLASKLANAITKDPKRAAQLLDTAMNIWLPQALAADGQEGSTEPYVADDLLWGR